MARILWLAWFVLLSVSAQAAVLLNEVMYDPFQCSDAVCEWVELFNEGNVEVNLSTCMLDGKNLSGLLLPKSYVIVVRDAANFTANFGNGSSLIESRFSLANDGDTVILNGSASCSEVLNYTSLVPLAQNNHKTLERRQDGTWGESMVANGTHGRENSIHNQSGDYSQIIITEILPDPFGDDDAEKPLGEWVELYNRGAAAIDVAGFIIRDDQNSSEIYVSDTQVVGGTLLPRGGFLVVYRNRDSDFSLDNIGFEQVRLFSPLGELLDRVTYAGSTEGMSWSLVDGIWYLLEPTPGRLNQHQEACDWQLELLPEGPLIAAQDFSYRVRAERRSGFPQNLTVRGNIVDSQGRIRETYAPWTSDFVSNSISKRYSPGLSEGTYQISFWMENLSCSDQRNDNNNATLLVSTSPLPANESTLKIGGIKPSSRSDVRWGDSFTVDLAAYKGAETKKQLKVWAEKDGKKISKSSTLELPTPFREYSFTIPVQLIPNCDHEIADGTAMVMAEGLGLHTEQEIPITDVDPEWCKDYNSSLRKIEREFRREDAAASIQYEFRDIPASALADDSFRAALTITNDEDEHTFEGWAYVYRGSRCYSCRNKTQEPDARTERIRVPAHGTATLDFVLTLDQNMEEGDYNFKAKIRKDKLKTTKDITTSLHVRREEKNITLPQQIQITTSSNPATANISELATSSKRTISELSGFIVYESNAEKAKGLMPAVLVVGLGLLSASLVIGFFGRGKS